MRRKVMIAVALSLVCETIVVARRRGSLVAVDTVVRCRDGHLSTTMWIPGASLKSIRLGWWRVQRCPGGPHWSLVTPVRVSTLTEEERQRASEQRDVRIP